MSGISDDVISKRLSILSRGSAVYLHEDETSHSQLLLDRPPATIVRLVSQIITAQTDLGSWTASPIGLGSREPAAITVCGSEIRDASVARPEQPTSCSPRSIQSLPAIRQSLPPLVQISSQINPRESAVHADERLLPASITPTDQSRSSSQQPCTRINTCHATPGARPLRVSRLRDPNLLL